MKLSRNSRLRINWKYSIAHKIYISLTFILFVSREKLSVELYIFIVITQNVHTVPAFLQMKTTVILRSVICFVSNVNGERTHKCNLVVISFFITNYN